MAKTQDLKRRIRSVRNTMQVTKAMKMVSAAKLRRAQDRIMNSRPYAQQTLAILQSLAARASAESHPLLQSKVGKKAHMIVLAGDKGLCGAFNSNIIRAAEHYAEEHLEGYDISVTAVGKKSQEYFARHKWEIKNEWMGIFRDMQLSHADEIADAATSDVPRGRCRSRVRRLQRVQVGDPGQGDRPAAAPDPTHRGGRGRDAARTTSTNRRPTPCSARCCRTTFVI